MNRQIILNQNLLDAQSTAEAEQLKQLATCAQLLSALGDPIRLQIVVTLLRGPRSVSYIASAIDCDISKTSHHLKVLKRAGLLVVERDAKQLFHSLRPGFATVGKGRTPTRLDLECCVISIQ